MVEPLLQYHQPIDLRICGTNAADMIVRCREVIFDEDKHHEHGYVILSPVQFRLLERLCTYSVESREALQRQVKLYGYQVVVLE